MNHILVLEDDATLNRAVCKYLNDSGFDAKGFLNVNDAYDAMYGTITSLSSSCQHEMICQQSKRDSVLV